MRIAITLALVSLSGALSSCTPECDPPIVQGGDTVIVQGADSVMVQGADSVIVQGADSTAAASGMGRRIVMTFPGQTRRAVRLATGDTVIVLIKRRRP